VTADVGWCPAAGCCRYQWPRCTTSSNGRRGTGAARKSLPPCTRRGGDSAQRASSGSLLALPSDVLSDAPLIIPMIIQTIGLDPTGAVWTDEASNVSRLDPSGADQADAEHPARNRKVEGSNPSSGSKTADQRGSRALLTAQRQPAVIPLGRTSRPRRNGPLRCVGVRLAYPALWDGPPSSAHDGWNYQDGDWAGPTDRALIRAHRRKPTCGSAAISTPSPEMLCQAPIVGRRRLLDWAGLACSRVVGAATPWTRRLRQGLTPVGGGRRSADADWWKHR
jgi:hypothetical protein